MLEGILKTARPYMMQGADPSNRGPDSISDGIGRNLNFTYDDQNYLTRVEDGQKRAWQFAYEREKFQLKNLIIEFYLNSGFLFSENAVTASKRSSDGITLVLMEATYFRPSSILLPTQ